MLVLSRKQQETICIGPNIRVTVLKVKGRSVKIGIEAPPGMHILRQELTVSGGNRPTRDGVEGGPGNLPGDLSAGEGVVPKTDGTRPSSDRFPENRSDSILEGRVGVNQAEHDLVACG